MGRPPILFVNGALGGAEGNSAALLDLAARHLAPRAEVSRIDLSVEEGFATHAEAVGRAQGFVFATGTYWDSWGSPLQRFLEEATPTEGSDLWLGKPVAVLVTEHSVGGKGVLSRLQGVLSTFGLLLPPMAGLVLSAVAQGPPRAPPDPDLWCPADLEIVCHNLLEAVSGGRAFRAWPTDPGSPGRRWLRTLQGP